MDDRVMERFFNMALNPKGVTFSVLSSIHNAMLVADANIIVRYVNAKYLEITGLKYEEIIGKNLQEVRPQTVLPQVIHSGEARTDLLSRTVPNAVVDMSVPLAYKGMTVGGISILKESQRIQLIYKELEKFMQMNDELKQELKNVVVNAYSAKYLFSDIVGYSPLFQHILTIAKKLAGFEADILITGESGTGKELFAQAIHNASARSNMPFVPVNCSTLSPTLVESELFGYDSDAFTGAVKGGKVGMFSVANGGTIMLDEIGELPYEMQAKLLRVLQERTVRKVGGAAEIPVNVKVIAATNKNLLELVRVGKFREDLYYRLTILRLDLPSLRERRDDIRPLADALLAEWNKKQGKSLHFHPGVYDKMVRYDWPGNIRELKNAVHFAAFLCDTDVIASINLPEQCTPAPGDRIVDYGELQLKDIVDITERNVIKEMIRKYGDTLEAKKEIAVKLGISLPTLYNKLKSIESHVKNF